MTAPTRLIAAVVLGATTGFALAQPPVTPPPQGQTPPAPQGQAPEGRGRSNAPPGQRRGGFTQFTRPLAPEDVLVRGKALYDTNCASCHAADLRGTADGENPNLLRSGVALRDQQGELIGARLARHTPPITLIETDTFAVAEYIHSVHATMGGQGSPPGRYPTNLNLNVLVGEPEAGEAMFAAVCGSCHSVTGDLRGIGSKFSDPRALQNAWVSGSTTTFGGRGGGRGGGGGGVPAIVTMADGSKLEGTLVREDDFLVVLILPDGTRKSMARKDGVPRVEVKDPRAGHVDAIVKLAHEDMQNKMLHDITAYLWTIK
ncbi:MAG: c-type cytochrome [Acidobacteria bacterium]|nr:c-type cytochrome [Acidobacteriota bacterium]